MCYGLEISVPIIRSLGHGGKIPSFSGEKKYCSVLLNFHQITAQRLKSDSLKDILQYISKVSQINIFITSTRSGVRMKMPSVNSQNVSHFIISQQLPHPLPAHGYTASHLKADFLY